MVHFEVVLRPNFNSTDHYEVLGCQSSASKEELTEAYRGLSWKYHPQNRPDDADSMRIFVRLSEAYYALVLRDIESPPATGSTPRSTTTPNETPTTTTTTHTKRRSGRSTTNNKLYYNDGGIFGLPYAHNLKEHLTTEEGKKIRGSPLQCGRIQLGFFLGFLLKLKIDWILAIIEIVLTAGTVAACK